MADEARDAERSPDDDEADASDDIVDADSEPSDDTADGDGEESTESGFVYGRVESRDETESDASDETERGAVAETDADAEADVDAEAEPDADADVEAESASESGSDTDADDADVDSDSDSDVDTEPDADSDSDADSEDDDTESVPSNVSRMVPESETDSDAEIEDDSGDDIETPTAIDAETAPGGDDPVDSSELPYAEGDSPVPSPEADSLVDDGVMGSAPESDQEMPLTDHIEEMIRRLAVVFAVAGTITLLLFPGADMLNAYVNTGLPSATDVINFLWNTHIPSAAEMADRRPRLYGPLELILTKLKVAGLAGTVIGLPVFVYETYLFMRPGLFPKERKYYLAAVPTSLVLAIIGVTFAHFVVLPAIFAYFTSYTEGTAVIAFGLKETFNLILILMGYMAIVFQIPLFVQLAIMMNLVTRQWLEDRRLLFWGAFLGLAFLVSPDPTGMAPIIVGATMIVLFEGTLALLRWTGN
ncbi:sec-independent protein translocase component TatC1 [Haloferax elongans ATCC BAA-1513]|uniref:Sec-independent protein translocase protein TatC n=1 Tax=Haloferax elongans ATCC BAA-1513 TaxID=1230453 RepID=M0HW18_HALEO|nr:twin-arginine translocase subunit TatC [Haloferax elongans]ELZ87314.1 sec-independent protein translocase component TatC1 [Haloferax elongans ATCC BAA-1513]